ncbi:Survival factor [Lachnellula hyalina]|uniref:Survival factor n=1 Tax=Lachnellula hyalina TaxID=1316788 RepID=A0A8H8U3E8_9HELO|nr:Survival factor [Lachnellula hyalina]TVY30222.1 Survival factor [Lachnellula hyalina]
MMNWAKQTLANVAGTQEPIYGPSAIQTVTKQAETTPYTELTQDDLKWDNLPSTSVETQGFYFFAKSGHIAMAQIIHSNVAGIKRTSQFNTKIFYPKKENKAHLWSSDPLSDVDFSDDGHNFYARDVAVELVEDGKTYTIKSLSNEKSIVNLTVTQEAPGFKIGKDGKTYYGTDPEAPWGFMRHEFWPRAKSSGTIVTDDGTLDLEGQAMFIHANQGMKPHHAAGKWKFINFQGPTYSAVFMQFTTPPSYGSTVVNMGGVVKGSEILTAGTSISAEFTKVKPDTENDWPEPEAIRVQWTGKTKDGKSVEAVLDGPLDERLDRIDVMAEVPGFVKAIVASAAGTRPYIYQYSPHEHPVSVKVKVGDEEVIEEGILFSEATFISA